MLALFPARLAIEGQEDEAPRIEAGEEGHENADPKGHHAAAAARISGLEDAVLRIEAGKASNPRDTDAGERQRAEHTRPISDRARFPPTYLITPILLMVNPIDHRRGPQETQHPHTHGSEPLNQTRP